MEKMDLQKGDVVQIDPTKELFGGCFMTVTEPKPWGAQGYIAVPGKEGLVYFRCAWEHMEFVGKACWVSGGTDDD